MKLVSTCIAVLAVGAIGLTAFAVPSRATLCCDGERCAGFGSHAYYYRVASPGFPVIEFTVGTNDVDRLHYADVLLPTGWNFALEATGLDSAHGTLTDHGDVSPGPGMFATHGRARWWTADPAHAVESFTFGFTHSWTPVDVGWEITARRDATPPYTITFSTSWSEPVGGGFGPVHGPGMPPAETLALAAEEFVETQDGLRILVPGYSVPSFVRWDGDELPDLVIGEGGGFGNAKVRVYPNIGEPCRPEFQDWFYVQANGADLVVPASGCLGCFPRGVYWDDDGKKDLLVGQAMGTVSLFRNVGTDDAPDFDAGTTLQVGPTGSKVNINVTARATPTVVDWNDDGKRDLVVGSYDGKLRVFLNEGEHYAPDFQATLFVTQPGGGQLVVPGSRSSPDVRDLNGDGVADILTGNTNGQLLRYDGPDFGSYVAVEAAGIPIDLAGMPRSRPFVCHWRDDPFPDVLIGAGDGFVHLYESGREALALEAAPRIAAAGESIDFTVHHGVPTRIALLALIDVNGAPCFQIHAIGSFDDEHRWMLTETVPAGLAGTTATFQAGGVALSGRLAATNEITIVFN